MYLAVAVVGYGSKLLDATKGLLSYMIRTHAESYELVRDIIGTILIEPLVEVGCACSTVICTDDTTQWGCDLWAFGKDINGEEIYIKIGLGLPNRQTVCVSFHRADFPIQYPFK